MRVNNLALVDFRNYSGVRVSFSPGLNVVIGKNGQGKTNLIEAIYVLSAKSTYRSTSLGACVKHDCSRAVVHGEFEREGAVWMTDIEVSAQGRLRVKPAGSEVGLTTVLFSPEDLSMIKAGPEHRRRFVDVLSAKLRPGAGRDKAEFDRVLRQRTGAVKAARSSETALRQLGIWDHQMAESGAKLAAERFKVCRMLDAVLEEKYRVTSRSSAKASIFYRPRWASSAPETPDGPPAASELLEALQRSRGADIEAGMTLTGPHRDDFSVQINDAPARLYGSQGEQRTLALSLRMAEHYLVTETLGRQPILLVDDVFSELDSARRAEVSKLLSEAGQAIATSTELGALDRAPDKVLEITAGNIADVA